jgi:hypothetical protein
VRGPRLRRRPARAGPRGALRLGLLARPRVAYQGEDAPGPVGRAVEPRECELDRDLVAVARHRDDFDRRAAVDDRPVAGASVLLEARQMGVPDARWDDQLFDAVADRFGIRVAEEPLGGGVPEEDAARLSRGDHDRVGDLPEEVADAELLGGCGRHSRSDGRRRARPR